MSAAEWYLAIFSLGVGASMPLFWAAALAGGRFARLAAGRDDIWFHVAAEAATGGTLLAAGLGMTLEVQAAWVDLLSALGLGMLVYSLVRSPGHYLAGRHRLMGATFAGTWMLAVPAIVIRFAIRG